MLPRCPITGWLMIADGHPCHWPLLRVNYTSTANGSNLRNCPFCPQCDIISNGTERETVSGKVGPLKEVSLPCVVRGLPCVVWKKKKKTSCRYQTRHWRSPHSVHRHQLKFQTDFFLILNLFELFFWQTSEALGGKVMREKIIQSSFFRLNCHDVATWIWKLWFVPPCTRKSAAEWLLSPICDIVSFLRSLFPSTLRGSWFVCVKLKHEGWLGKRLKMMKKEGHFSRVLCCLSWLHSRLGTPGFDPVTKTRGMDIARYGRRDMHVEIMENKTEQHLNRHFELLWSEKFNTGVWAGLAFVAIWRKLPLMINIWWPLRFVQE